MGAFFLEHRGVPHSGPSVIETARKLFEKQGFVGSKLFETKFARVLVFPKQVAPAGNWYDAGDQGFCTATGTFIYRGQSGVAALKAFHADFDPQRLPHDDIYGAFCIIIAKHGRVHLLVDRLGIYKVYKDSAGRYLTSSFLGLLGVLKRREIDRQSVYEYVFHQAAYGGDTVVRDIKLADCDKLYMIDDLITTKSLPDLAVPSFEARSIDDHLDRTLGGLRAFYKIIARCFGNDIDAPLSGGYDSRLNLALLLDQGISPEIHVYGRSDDADVGIARTIAEGERYNLAHVDKNTWPQPGTDEFTEILRTNFYAFDGYPNDGIFDPGADIETRRDRCRNGKLMLNGGGGEVFRNFYYLRNRSYSVSQFVSAFYSRFDPFMCSPRFSVPGYHAKLGEKIKGVLKLERDQLTRAEIELLYPIFRCRYWMGRNNSVNTRLGETLTPFIDYKVVRDAMGIPLAYKNSGLFEGRLLRRLNPGLAAYPSVYGHGFDTDPPLKRRLKDLATLWRPILLRRYSYRLQARSMSRQRPYVLQPSYMSSVLPEGFFYMKRFFDMDAMTDVGQLARAATLEYLFQSLDVDPPPD